MEKPGDSVRVALEDGQVEERAINEKSHGHKGSPDISALLSLEPLGNKC